jgi:hypothetical protein
MKYLTTFIVTLLMLKTLPSAFAQVTQYVVAKDEIFNQTSTAAPSPDATAPWRLDTLVAVSAQSDLSSNPTVTAPSGGTGATPLTLTYNAGSGQYRNRVNFSDRASLDAAYPDGTYVMHMVSPAFGTKNVSLTINPASYAFPTDIPKLSNTTWSNGMLQLDPTVSSTLSWNPFSQLSGNDYVIFDLFGQNVSISQSGNLTSFTINANTLVPGQTYNGDIDFIHITTFDTTSVSGATGQAGYDVFTRFTIQAVPEPSILGMLGFGAFGLLGAVPTRKRRV